MRQQARSSCRRFLQTKGRGQRALHLFLCRDDSCQSEAAVSAHTPLSTDLQTPGLELLARAFNAAPNGFLIVDASGTIVAVNTELELMFGLRADELIGQPVEVLLPESSRGRSCGLAARLL